MTQLVLLRHGESQWNRENRLTGWADVGLTERGRQEARRAGKRLRGAGLEFDVVHTSLLRRAITTAFLALEEMDRLWLPVHRSWRLNERHYGALTGRDRSEFMGSGSGAARIPWSRSYAAAPPPMAHGDPANPASDLRYDHLEPTERPRAESLEQTFQRVGAVWQGQIRPDLQAGKRVLIVGHGNALGMLVKRLDGLGEQEAMSLSFPTAGPLVYKLGEDQAPIERAFLAD